jgi:hypothetical protein
MLNRTPFPPEWRSPRVMVGTLVMVSTLLFLSSGCVIHVLENVRLSDVNPTSQRYESGFPSVDRTTDLAPNQSSQPTTRQDWREMEDYGRIDTSSLGLDREGLPDL